MDKNLESANEARVQRVALERELEELERAIAQQRRLHLAAVAGEAELQAADLQASIDSLLTRLAVVNVELAALNGVTANSRV